MPRYRKTQLDAIDVAVATHVMKWHLEERLADGNPRPSAEWPAHSWWINEQGSPKVCGWRPTRQPDQALEVLSYIEGLFVVNDCVDDDMQFIAGRAGLAPDQIDLDGAVRAPTAALAICLAALRAFGVEVPGG